MLVKDLNMKVLNLSLDQSIAKENARTASRIVEYGQLVDKYTVIAPARENKIFKISDKVEVYCVGGENKILKLLNCYKFAKNILNRESYDVVTVQDQYYLALIGLRLAKKFKVGLELQIHGFEKYFGLRKLIAKYVLSRAVAVRCVSQRLKKQLINEFSVKEKRITVVPIFVDTALPLRGAERRGNLIPGKLIFFSAGRLVPVKNFQIQIEAMTEVVKKYPDIELWIAGDGPEKENLKFKIRDLKLEKNIKLLGWRSGLAELYGQIDVFMLTSNAEGWPLVIVEAANHGLPIIMTDVGSAGELIINNESGLVVPVGDKQKLAEAMLKIIEDENLKKKLGANAKLAVRRLPGKEQILELYKKSWEAAMGNNMSAKGGSASGGKLLILTQKVDIADDVLGFMHGWVEEFAKNFETVTVICLYQGRYEFSDNVKVLSLGKENKNFQFSPTSPGEAGRAIFPPKADQPVAGNFQLINKLKYTFKFYRYIWRERNNYDAVFVHMNQIYVILGGWFWRLTGKKIGFWYAHGQVGIGLKLAEKLTNYIFTPTADSFRVASKKINVPGHGIDTEKFSARACLSGRQGGSALGGKGQMLKAKNNNEINIITIGRISPSKDYETLILAMANWRERQPNKKFKISIIGKPGDPAQEKYLERLRGSVTEKKLNGQINFIGSIPNKDIVGYLQSADLFVNMSHTGGLDKAVLEAMACGVPVITCNETFKKILSPLNLFFKKRDYYELAEKVNYIYEMDISKRDELGVLLSRIVKDGHNLKSLVEKIKNIYYGK